MQSGRCSVCVHKVFGCKHHVVVSIFGMASTLGTACMGLCMLKCATVNQPYNMLVIQVMTIYPASYRKVNVCELTCALQTCVKVALGLSAIVVIIAAVIGVVVGAQHHGQSPAAAAVTPSSSLVSTSSPTLHVLCYTVVQCIALQ